jgi:hypothetical protein
MICRETKQTVGWTIVIKINPSEHEEEEETQKICECKIKAHLNRDRTKKISSSRAICFKIQEQSAERMIRQPRHKKKNKIKNWP